MKPTKQIEQYRGYTLTTNIDPTDKGQSTLIFAANVNTNTGIPVACVYADKSVECSILKAKKRIDSFFPSNK